MNCASSTTNSAASENRVCTSHRALATGLRRVMHIAAPATASTEKVQNTTCVSNTAHSPRGSEGSRSEEHTSELQSLAYLVCRLLLEKKKQLVTRRIRCASP